VGWGGTQVRVEHIRHGHSGSVPTSGQNTELHLLCSCLALAVTWGRFAVLCCAALLPSPRSLLIRDLPHATIKVDADSAASGPVADHQGPHFAIMKAALQQHWKLDQPGSPAVPVLPVLVPSKPVVGVCDLCLCF
jgi:hypothetical protein